MNFKVLTLIGSLLVTVGISSPMAFSAEVDASDEVNGIAQSSSTENDQQLSELSEEQINSAVEQFEQLVRGSSIARRDPSRCDASAPNYLKESSQLTAGGNCLNKKSDPCEEIWKDCLARRIIFPLQCTFAYYGCTLGNIR